ncbi:hypothetical protein KAU32_11980 [bacterium]|nr:hypothetical protein [bacterium]
MVSTVWQNPVLLIVVPLGLAFFTPIIGLIRKELVKYIPILGMLFNLTLSLFLLPKVLDNPIIVSLSGWKPPFAINLFVGPVGILFSILISLVGLLTAIYGINYIKKGAVEKYHMLFLLLLTGATGIVLTGDIFNLFVFFEILCISSYALVAYNQDKNGIEAATKYLIQGSLGSAFILLGIGFLYGLFGTLNMADIARNITTVDSPALFIAMALFITGFGVEAAIFPLNAWLPDAHSSAPSTISAILSGIAIHIGIYAIFRVLYTLFGFNSIFTVLAVIGIVTLLIGEMSAFRQENIKRVLAYSSMGQMGLIIFALSIGTVDGISGGLFQIITHTLSKSLLFLCVGYMVYSTNSMELSSLNGLGKRMPLISLLFTIGVFSLIGLPPFIGFPSKLSIILAGLKTGETLFLILIVLMLLATVIEGVYFFRIIQILYFKEPDKEERFKTPFTLLFPVIILGLLIVAIGIYPGLLQEILDRSAEIFWDKLSYIKIVFGG